MVKKRRRRRRRRRGRNWERAGRACFERPNRLLPSNFRGAEISATLRRRNSNRRPSCPRPARPILDKPPTHTLAQTQSQSQSQTPTLPPTASQPGDQCGKKTQHEQRGGSGRAVTTPRPDKQVCRWEALGTPVCFSCSQVTD